jgi:hypothetical protein
LSKSGTSPQLHEELEFGPAVTAGLA